MLRSILMAVCLISMLPQAVLAEETLVEDTALVDLQGAGRTLSEFTGRGEWTVAMIWASYCGICRHEAPGIEAFRQKYKHRPVRVVGVSVDGVSGLEDARGFVADYGLSFPNLVGQADDVALMYYDLTGTHMIGTPSFLVFDPQGELRTFQAGAIELGTLEQLVSEQATVATLAGGQ